MKQPIKVKGISPPPPDLPPVNPVPAVASIDPLARLQRLLATTATLYAGTEDEALRSALAVTALKQIVDEATRAIATLEG